MSDSSELTHLAGCRGRAWEPPGGLRRPRAMRRRVLVLLAAMGALAAGGACSGGDGDGDVVAGESPGWTGSEVVRGTASVLQSPEHGPQLCWEMEASLPPQCAGPDVVGWDWEVVDGEESANGTTWGSFLVTGTWDGTVLTLTEPPGPAGPPSSDFVEVDFSSPCPEPAGGWAPLNRAATTQQTLDAATAAAQARPDVAAVWADQSVNPASVDLTANAALMNDPLKLVLNVRVTGDVQAAQRDLRTIWGGALCVSPAELTHAELEAIRTEVDARRDELGLRGVNALDVNGVVEALMVVEPAGLQSDLDAAYGEGVVVVSSLLQPVG